MEIYNYNGDDFTVVMNDVPLFRATEIATILRYKNPRDAILRHVDEEDIFTWDKIRKSDKATLSRETLLYEKSYKSDTKFINESGVYSLILKSKMPAAKKFKRWVTAEVLPSLRKTGKYEMTPERRLSLLKEGLSILKDLGPLDERDALFIKSEVKNVLAGEAQSTDKRREVPISDRIVQLGYKYRPNDRKTGIAIGLAMKNAYFEKHGKAPPKREQFVDGATRMVCCYTEDDFDILDPIIKRYYKNL